MITSKSMRIQLRRIRTRAKKQIYFLSMGKILSGLLRKIYKGYNTKSGIGTEPNSNVGLNDYYQSVEDIPLFNWIKCTEGELKYVRKGKKGNTDKDTEAWFAIYDDYIRSHGLSKKYQQMIKAMRKKAEIGLDYAIKRDRFSLTLLEIEIQNLKMLLDNNGQGVSIEQSLVHLSRFVGYWIRSKEITAGEYFTLIKEYERINKLENGEKNK